MNQITTDNILSHDKFEMVPVGTTVLQPPTFPGVGNNTFNRNGINYTTLATKAAVINKFEESFIERPGYLIEALDDLPYLAIELDHAEYEFSTRQTTFELPHRAGSGVFALKHSKSTEWNFEELLYEEMKKRGPYNALAYFDPISALLGAFLSHYKSIPSQFSKFTGAVVGGCIASGTQPVISSGVTKDPLGSNRDEHLFLENEKTKASASGLGNIIHLESGVDAEKIQLNLYLNKPRLRFYTSEIQEVLTLLYKYGALKCLSNGIDFRNGCFLKANTEVEFNEPKLKRELQRAIKKAKEAGHINDEPLIRRLPVSYFK